MASELLDWRLRQAGCSHFPMVTGEWPAGCQVGRPLLGSTRRSATSRRRSPAPTITSAPKHAQRYLASYAWRFNRRYQLDSLTERLGYACTRTAPHPYRVIIAG